MTQNMIESNRKRRTKETLLEERQEKSSRERYMEYKKRLKTASETKTEWLKKHDRPIPSRKKTI